MEDSKIDPEKYAGLSQEEAERRMEEDRVRAINEDPRTIAAFRALDERKAAQEAEERHQAENLRRQQGAEVAAQWEEEKERRKRRWVDAGGTKEEFEAAWPELRKGILMERMFAPEREREARARETARSVWDG